MYECPNCAGNLKFDIARQKLACEYCNTLVDPYDFHKERDAQESKERSGSGQEEYEVTVFTCPQCGGELISEDTTAATFCSFCGASVILDSRISRERRPGVIIPFQKTKEDCRAAYKRMVRRAVFAPRGLRDEALIEKFRGIYMPYWVYSFEKEGRVSFPGEITYRQGDYLYTEHYQLSCQVEENYRGLAYDASSTFSDRLSNAIAPFDLREGKEFTPAFLSGFYGDTSDVEDYVYRSEAEEVVLQDAGGQLAENPLCKKYHAHQGENGWELQDALRPSKRKTELAMLPVWFLAYRNGDRVCYGVVNGQTGRAAADLPVDGKRYLAGSLLLAVPFFLLLNRFLTLTPGKLLGITILLSLLCIWISNGQLTRILARESGEEDKGLTSVRLASGGGTGQEKPSWESVRRAWGKRSRKKALENSPVKIILIVCAFYGVHLVPALLRRFWNGMDGRTEIALSVFIFLLVGFCLNCGFWMLDDRVERPESNGPFLGGHFQEKLPTLVKPMAGIVASVVIAVVRPVSDWIYYMGALGCMGTVLWAILDIIRQHNQLTTRKLSQLGRRGGDEGE